MAARQQLGGTRLGWHRQAGHQQYSIQMVRREENLNSKQGNVDSSLTANSVHCSTTALQTLYLPGTELQTPINHADSLLNPSFIKLGNYPPTLIHIPCRLCEKTTNPKKLKVKCYSFITSHCYRVHFFTYSKLLMSTG